MVVVVQSQNHQKKNTRLRIPFIVFSFKKLSWHQAIFTKPLGFPIVTPSPFHHQVRDGLVWFQRS